MSFNLVLLSVAALAGAVISFVPGVPSWLMLVAGAAALVLAQRLLRRKPKPKRNWIVVDGSNVLHWQDETPNLQTVRDVVGVLKGQGFEPVVWFDANVGYKIGDFYMGELLLARKLGLPDRAVFVAPKGTPADPLLLAGAEELGARVVTNDKFRDWEGDYARITEPGFLVKGRVTDDAVELGL